MRVFLILLATLLGSACATSPPVPKHQVGQDFQTSFPIGVRNTSIPLPGGSWKLVGYQQQPNNIGKLMNHAFLIQTDNGKLSKFIEVISPDDFTTWGYLPSEFCDRKDVIHVVRRINQDGDNGGKQDCWGINHWRMTWGEDPMDYWKQFISYTSTNGITVPINALIVKYRKANKNRFVEVVYGFNPELEGFAPPVYADWDSSDWHKDRYRADKDKVKYIDTLKRWGEKWESSVNAGFDGRYSVNAVPVTVQNEASDVSEKLSQLKKLVEDGVITQDDYEKKKQEILDDL